MGSPQTVQPVQFDARRLEHLFHQCFYATCRTRLCGGRREPLYQPATRAGQDHIIYYRHDYFASALHEVAHWCIAGEQRRRQVDYGYWYAPEGRDRAQQSAFESVECQPQALEWVFARACGYPFRLSVDNLDTADGELPDTAAFAHRVHAQVLTWHEQGLPLRAQKFFDMLASGFGTERSLPKLSLELADIR